MDPEPTRRAFLRGAAVMGGTLLASPHAKALVQASSDESGGGGGGGDILRQPDSVTAYSGLKSPHTLDRQNGTWSKTGVLVTLTASAHGNAWGISVASAATALSHLHLRWNVRMSSGLRCLGDAWERGYGDLEWRGIVPERVMPWYFLTHDGRVTRGYGPPSPCLRL